MTLREESPSRTASGEGTTGSLPGVRFVGAARTSRSALMDAVARSSGEYLLRESPDGEDSESAIAASLEADCVVWVAEAGANRPELSRESLLVAMLNLPEIVLAVVMMDTTDSDQSRYESIVAGFRDTYARLCQTEILAVPVTAADADNVRIHSARSPWHDGPTLPEAIARVVDRTRVSRQTGKTPSTDEADQFEARLLWLSDKPMVSGRQYGIAVGGTASLCTPERPKYRLATDTLQRLAAKTLRTDDVGIVNIALERPVRFRPYPEHHDLGRFTLRDRKTGNLVGIGLIHFALRRSTNVQLQSLSVTPGSRASLKGHEPCVLWFTGLSGSGKSTISNLVERTLNGRGCHTILLDGDNVRHGLNRDLGFTEADRAENIRRIAEVAKLMTDAGLIVLVSFISPFAAERRMARELVGSDRFLEIFVDTPLEVAEARDVKGLYKKARRGEIRNFTGIDSPYERPDTPELRLMTGTDSAEDCAARVLDLLHERDFTS